MPSAPIPLWLQKYKAKHDRGSQADLLARTKAGDRRARDLLILQNLGLVTLVTRRFRHRADYDDLFAAGLQGMSEGVEAHDPERGGLSTVCVLHIRQRVWRYLYQAGCAVAMGWGKEIREAAVLLRFATPGDGTPLGAIAAAMNRRQPSLDKPIGDDGDMTGLDFLESPGDLEHETIDREDKHAARRIIEFALKACPDREAEIVRQRWLIEDPVTLEVPGAQFEVSRERIRQLELIALRRMAERLGSRVRPVRILELLQESVREEERRRETLTATRHQDTLDFNAALREQIERARNPDA